MKTKIILDVEEIGKALLLMGTFTAFFCISRFLIGMELTQIFMASVILTVLTSIVEQK